MEAAGSGISTGPEVRRPLRFSPPVSLAQGSPSSPLQVEPPELPGDLQHWVAYNEASSQLLRAESGLGDAAKDQ